MAYCKEQRICYKFCFKLKKIASKTSRMLTKVSYDDTMCRVQTLNGIHVSCHQTSARGFECSGPPSDWWKCGIYASSWLWEVHMFDDVSNILGTSYSAWWTKDLRQIAAKFVPICWKMTRNKTNFLCARACKNRPKREETSIQFTSQNRSCRDVSRGGRDAG